MLWWTLRKLKSSAPEARLAAIKDLVGNPDPRALDGIISCLQDSATSVVSAAVEALSTSADSRAQIALASCLESSDTEFRRRTAEALIKYPYNPLIFQRMLRLELSKKCEEHGWAASFASNLTDSASIQFFLSLMEEKDYYLRMGGAKAMGRVGVAALPHLLNRKEKKDDYTTSSALKEIRDPNAVEPLIKAVETRHPKYRAIPEALGEIGDPRATKCLAELFNSEKSEAVAIALKKLGWTPTTDSERAYIAAYNRDWNTLVNLGSVSTEGLLKMLTHYMGAPPEAYEVASKIADERAIDLLLAKLGEVVKHRKREKIDGIYSEEYKTRSEPSDPSEVRRIYNTLLHVLERNVQRLPVAALEKISDLEDSLIVVMQEYASCRGRPDEVLSQSVAVDFSSARQLAKQELVRRR